MRQRIVVCRVGVRGWGWGMESVWVFDFEVDAGVVVWTFPAMQARRLLLEASM